MPNRIFGKLLDIAKNIKDRCQVNRNTEKKSNSKCIIAEVYQKKNYY